MSGEYEVKKGNAGCTRALFLKDASACADPRERLYGMVMVCYELLRKAAEINFTNRRGASGAVEEDVYRDDMSETVVGLYDFLRSFLERTTKGDDILSSPKGLLAAWNNWKRSRRSGRKKADAPESPDEVALRRWSYYRARLAEVLREKGRRVASRDMGGWSEHYFTYGARELPRLNRGEFQERLAEIVRNFKPSLKDEDFWRGEEPLYREDGTEGRHEGPGADRLDQFCREFWCCVAQVFGREYVLELSMVGEALRKLFTFFAPARECSLDADADEELDGGDGGVPDPVADEGMFPGSEGMPVSGEKESVKEMFRHAARRLSARNRKLLLLDGSDCTLQEKARRLGQRSCSRIGEQTEKARTDLREKLHMSGLPDYPPDWFDAESLRDLFDIACDEWEPEKKELESFGPLEKCYEIR